MLFGLQKVILIMQKVEWTGVQRQLFLIEQAACCINKAAFLFCYKGGAMFFWTATKC